MTVKLRLASFKTITRSRTLPEATSDIERVVSLFDHLAAVGVEEQPSLDDARHAERGR